MPEDQESAAPEGLRSAVIPEDQETLEPSSAKGAPAGEAEEANGENKAGEAVAVSLRCTGPRQTYQQLIRSALSK